MPPPLIEVRDLHFSYNPGSDREIKALRGISLDIPGSAYIAIIGANGSGKSTLARHFNALLLPSQGDVWVRGLNTRERRHHQAIRHCVGMVFQDPDNQVVATIVEEDVAFGPENLGLPPEELLSRVDWALQVVGLADQRQRSPLHLSAGQRQRLALAGALAMRPACLVLDEASAMLDPAGRRATRLIVRQLHGQGATIVSISQRMEEAVEAQRVIVLSQGRVVLDGSPARVFAEEALLRQLGLELPPSARLARLLHERCPSFPPDLLTPDELVRELKARAAFGPPADAGGDG
ncbi:MAG: energy-coupling factor transporter ATPase [Chloroflexia bacterium]|nr:energy-coupling factor transporter ATPase [Chloroflexia bacterium]